MRGMIRKAGATALVAVLLGGAAACGDDDDSDATDDTAPAQDDVAAGDPAAYCDALLEFNSAVFEVELEEDATEDQVVEVGEQLAPLSQRMADNAPPEVADAIEGLHTTAIEPLLEGEAEAFNSDETFGQYTALVDASGPVCDFQEVSVVGKDWFYEGVPATLAAGQYSIALANEGTEEHELVLFRKQDATPLDPAELSTLSDEEFEAKLTFAGAAFAPPGGSGSTLTELEPGSYVMLCGLPVGGAEDGKPHFEAGMLAEFTVE